MSPTKYDGVINCAVTLSVDNRGELVTSVAIPSVVTYLTDSTTCSNSP